jgi:uncharacterized membrane protein HdeD (DUF308 family)
VLAYGIALVLIGVIALTNPLATGLATGLLLAIVLVLYGVAAIASALSAFAQRGRWIELILGLLALAAGLAIFFAPYLGALSLVWAIGFWLAVSAVFQIATAIRFVPDRWWRLFLGLLDLVLGAILLFAAPAAGLAYLALIVGISFLFKGVFFIVLAFALRRLVTTLPR